MLNFQTMTLMVLVILSIVVYTNAWSGNVCTKTLAGRRSVQTCTSFMVFGRRCTVRYITTYSTKYFCCSGWTETIPGNTECSKRIPLNPNVVESYNEVPQLAWRNLYSGEEVVDDRALSSGTYTAGKYFDMVTTEVDPTTVGCGAKRNIWLNDTLPTEDGFFHPKTVCVTDMETNDSCADSFTIEIHNGGDFRVYALEQYSHGNDSISYCFDLVMPSDPCNGFRPNTLTDLASRRPGNTHLSLGDENLAGGWYSTGLYEMLSYIPDSDSAIRCGATVQIWMNDSFPESDGKHHARKLCVTDSETPCAPHYTVIRNCGSKYVYFLTPSPKPGSVYCFDIPSTSNDPAPLFTPTNLQVDFDLEWKSGMTEDVPHKPQLIFRCQFNKDNQQDLFYVVYFSADGNYVETLSQIIVQDPSEATLSEKILRFRGFSAGIMLSCHVGARNSKDGRTGEMVKSDELYAGIKFSKSSVDIQRGAKTTIGFYTTVPFACEYVSSAPDAPCYLSLHISNTRNDNACGNSLLFHQCTVTITGVTKVEYNRNGKSWNLNQELEIASAEGERGLFDLTRTEFGITMKGETTGHRFWHNSKSEEAIINIVDYKKLTTKIFNDKRCEIYCDPHHLSFDKMRFELQKEGKFLLFKTEVPHMEVQMETKFCGGDTNTVAYCACGIVVVAGHDIFEIYTCNNQLELGYIKACDDGVLRVELVKSILYRITLPTGARVDVSLRTNRLKYFFDIAIIPTNHEENNVITGLCGNLDSDSYNDCISRWGQAPCAEPPPDNDANLYIGGYSYSPHTFTESFRIPEEESLLYVEPNLNLIPPYPRSKLSCVCPHNGTEQCSLKEYISCDLQRHELSCMKPSISDYYNRRKREVPVQSVLGDNDRTERSSSVMTESEAIAACTQALTSSPVYTTCTSIGIPSSELQACTADLMLTGNPQWAVYAMDRFQSTCLDTITKNATLQEIFPDALDNIKQNTCPNDCYGNGVCSNGECVCKEGFASDDCSFDLSMPLTLSGLRNGDLCDLKNGCDAISIQGHQFPYGRDYTCQFTGQMTLTNLSVYTLNVTNMTAQYRSIFELLCNLPEIESTSGKLGVEFNVSVSMDSSEFSTPWNFVVIDTTCQSFSYDEGTVSFHMKDGFCYIEGECVLNGAHNREDFCKECYSTQKSFDWSEATDCAVSADGDDSHVTVIAAVTCSVTIGLLLCLGLGLYCWKLSTIKPHGRADVVQNIHFHQRQHLDQMRKRKHTKMLSITSISNKIEPLPLADICN